MVSKPYGPTSALEVSSGLLELHSEVINLYTGNPSTTVAHLQQVLHTRRSSRACVIRFEAVQVYGRAGNVLLNV